MPDAHILRSVLRTDLTAFVEQCFREIDPATAYRPNWHIEAIVHKLGQVARGECRRLIINVPPRSLKSVTVSVGFTTWMLGHQPHKKIMAISYGADLAQQIGGHARMILQSRWFQTAFPQCKISSATVDEIKTTSRGYRLAGSIGGSILGRGADLIVIDDPLKGLEARSKAARTRVAEFYDNTLVTRLNDKQAGAIVIVMQRLHEDDLVGHVLTKGEWDVLSIPAIAVDDAEYALSAEPRHVYLRRAGQLLHPEREPQEVLDAMRRSLGTLHFSAQYQQAPIPAQGNIVKREWLQRYDRLPNEFQRIVCSWDTASTISETSDWSVGTVWGTIGSDYYLIDVIRGRWEVPDLRRRIIATHTSYRADATIIEETELGRAITQDMRRHSDLRAIMRPPRFDKEARFEAQSARFEAGQVWLPTQADWLAEYLSELLAFPSGRHDDQVDSTSQALHYLTGAITAEQNKGLTKPRPQRRERVRRQRF